MNPLKPNTGRLYNKHSALGYMLLQDRGLKELIESAIESIEDHITDNLKREGDRQQIAFLRVKQHELRSLI